jgi:GntR family transcriptional repressor for pyruvate dehydrogenase complex
MTSSRPFEPLARTTLAAQVRDDILVRIASGELQPGSQLPAERTLAEQFGVARTSVREALQALIALGIVERRGNRSFVIEQLPGAELPEAGGRRKAMRALLESRRVLEMCLFELAASRATGRERKEVLDLAMRPAPTALEEFGLVDRQFHAAIAGACANPVLAEMYGRVLDALVQADPSGGFLLGAAEGADPGEVIARAAAEHRAIAEAFFTGDVGRMLHAVEAHSGPIEGLSASRRQLPVRSRPDLPVRRTVGM